MMNWKEIWMTLFGTTQWLGLNIGFWAFSFGLASLANGAVSFVHHNVLSGLVNGAFIFANLMMSGLVLMTLGKIFKGQFWLK